MKYYIRYLESLSKFEQEEHTRVLTAIALMMWSVIMFMAGMDYATNGGM